MLRHHRSPENPLPPQEVGASAPTLTALSNCPSALKKAFVPHRRPDFKTLSCWRLSDKDSRRTSTATPAINDLRTSSPTEHAFVRIAGTTTAGTTENVSSSATCSPTQNILAPPPSSPS